MFLSSSPMYIDYTPLLGSFCHFLMYYQYAKINLVKCYDKFMCFFSADDYYVQLYILQATNIR